MFYYILLNATFGLLWQIVHSIAYLHNNLSSAILWRAEFEVSSSAEFL